MKWSKVIISGHSRPAAAIGSAAFEPEEGARSRHINIKTGLIAWDFSGLMSTGSGCPLGQAQ